MTDENNEIKIELYFLPISVGGEIDIGSALRNISAGIALGAALGIIASLIMY